jgi:hypothetical protein
MDATAQVTQAAKSALTVANILKLIFGLFVLFVILDILGMFFPAIAGFYQAPVSTVRRLIASRSKPSA